MARPVSPFRDDRPVSPFRQDSPISPFREEEETTLGGVLTSAGAGIAAGFTAPVRFAGAGLEVIEDITGIDLPGQTLTDISSKAQEWWQKRIGKSKAERLIGQAGETIGTIASNLALIAGTGGVAGAGGATTFTGGARAAAGGAGLLKTLAGGAGVEKTAEALREGAPRLNAYGAGFVTAATEYLTEKIPLSRLQNISKIGNGFFRDLAVGQVADIGGEMLATAVEMSITDKRILGKDRHLSTDEYLDILKETAAVAAISTMGLSAGAKTLDLATLDSLKKIQPIKPSEPHISHEKVEPIPRQALSRETAKTEYPELQKQVNSVVQDESLRLKPTTKEVPDITDVPPIKGERSAWTQTMDRGRAASREKRKLSFKKVRDAFTKAFVDVSGNLQGDLKTLGDDGRAVVLRQNAIGGSATKGSNEFDLASKPIYDGLNSKQKEMFDDMKSALRHQEIRNNKGAGFILPENHTEQSLQDHLGSIPDHLINDPSHPEGKGQLVVRNDAYKKAMDSLLQLAQDEGLRTPVETARLREAGREYEPRDVIEYLDPIIQRKNNDGKTISVRDSGLKELSEDGSDKLIETDSKLLLEQSYQRAWSRVFKNRANLELLNLARTNPDAQSMVRVRKPNEPVKPNEMLVSAMENGERVEMIMPLELGTEWITGDPILSSTLSSMIGWASGKKVLQSMATTLNPEFAITNPFRDAALIWSTTEEYNSLAPVAALQMSGDIAAVIKDFKELEKIYIDNGGGMEFLTQQSVLGLKGTRAPTKIIKALESIMGKAGTYSEKITRLALMRRAMRNGKTPFEATQIARGYLDFARGGSVAKMFNSGIPFFNAGIQATRGIARAAKENKTLFGFKMFQVMAMSFALYKANRGLWGDDYEDVPDWEKDNNWIFMTPYTFIDKNGEERRRYIRIPKDQGQRVFGKIGENMARKSEGEQVDHISIIEELGNILPIVPEANMSPTAEMLIGYSLNKDFWTREDIWQGEDVIPQEEYYKYTPTPYVKIGKATGMSPVRLKYMTEQLFTRGNIWTSMVGYASKQVFDEMSPEERMNISEQQLDRLPGVRRLLKSTRPDLRREKEIEKQKIQINTERLQMNRRLDSLSERFFSGQTDLREVQEFLKRQETAEDKKRLIRRFKSLRKLRGVTNRGFWFDLMDLPPEQRAVNYWNEWVQKDPVGRKEMDRQSLKVPGFRSKRFNRTFIKMRRFGEGAGR